MGLRLDGVGLRLREIGLGLCKARLIVAGLQREQHIASFHRLIVIDIDALNIALNLGGDVGDVGADVGVVGRDFETAVDQPRAAEPENGAAGERGGDRQGKSAQAGFGRRRRGGRFRGRSFAWRPRRGGVRVVQFDCFQGHRGLSL